MSLEVKLYNPSQLDRDEWRQLQSLQRDAFASVIDKPQEDIDFLVQWEDPNRFYDAHIDPNTEVGKRYNANQVYTHSKVAIAKANNELVGFAYSAHNTSGGGSPEGPHNNSLKARAVRRGKLLSITKNYLWLREFAVQPGLQRQGVAKQLGRILLNDAIERQPVTAYAWPDEIDFLPNILGKLGFSLTEEKPIHLFGEDKPEVNQIRYKAPSVSSVLNRLN